MDGVRVPGSNGVRVKVYRRLGIRYVGVLFVLAGVWAAFLTVVVVYVAADRYLGLPRAVTWHLMRLELIGVQVAYFCVATFLCWRSRSAIAWVRRRNLGDAPAAWDDVVRFPQRVLRFSPVPMIAGAFPGIVAISEISRAPWFMSGAIYLGVAFTVTLGAIVSASVLEVMLTPVLSDIEAALPRDFPREKLKTLSLRTRLILPGLLLVYSSAWLTSGTTARTTDPAMRLVETSLAALTVGLTFGLVLMVALSQSLLGRISDLASATWRVRGGDLTARVPAIHDDELGTLATSFNEMVIGLAEREALLSALGTYVDPKVAERLVAEGQYLDGEEVDVTILFVDIVGFSARAELMHAEDVCRELNDFFELVVPIVSAHNGHTNKLIGDGLMAVFGAPVALVDHADQAVAAACAIQEAMSQRYRGSLRAGCGLNSGPVVVGTMGGGTKLDFTVVGDAVNVASRVEAMTRFGDDSILLTEATRAAMSTPVALASRGEAPVRGRAEPISIYAPVSRVPA